MASSLTSRIVLAALGTAVLVTAGCDRGSNPFSAPPPDEFAVVKRRPLEMPPSVGLPEPRPGEPSRLDIDPNREAALALLGTPNPEVRASAPSSTEAELLAAADASAASSDIRVQLAEDQERGDDGPYEPPSIFELFGMVDPPAIDEEERLQPIPESQRLQQSGVIAPSDPLAAVPEERPERVPAFEADRPTTVIEGEPAFPPGGRPQPATGEPAPQPEPVPLELAPARSQPAAAPAPQPEPEAETAAVAPVPQPEAQPVIRTAPQPQPVQRALPVPTPQPVERTLPAPEPQPVARATPAPTPQPAARTAPQPAPVAIAEPAPTPAPQPQGASADSFYQKLGIVPPPGE